MHTFTFSGQRAQLGPRAGSSARQKQVRSAPTRSCHAAHLTRGLGASREATDSTSRRSSSGSPAMPLVLLGGDAGTAHNRSKKGCATSGMQAKACLRATIPFIHCSTCPAGFLLNSTLHLRRLACGSRAARRLEPALVAVVVLLERCPGSLKRGGTPAGCPAACAAAQSRQQAPGLLPRAVHQGRGQLQARRVLRGEASRAWLVLRLLQLALVCVPAAGLVMRQPPLAVLHAAAALGRLRVALRVASRRQPHPSSAAAGPAAAVLCLVRMRHWLGLQVPLAVCLCRWRELRLPLAVCPCRYGGLLCRLLRWLAGPAAGPLPVEGRACTAAGCPAPASRWHTAALLLATLPPAAATAAATLPPSPPKALWVPLLLLPQRPLCKHAPLLPLPLLSVQGRTAAACRAAACAAPAAQRLCLLQAAPAAAAAAAPVVPRLRLR